jgi:hypothetical protein
MGNSFGGGIKEILVELRRADEERRRAEEEFRRRADEERRRAEEERRRADEEIRRELAKVSSLLLCSYQVVVRDFNAYAMMSDTTVSRLANLRSSFIKHYKMAENNCTCALTNTVKGVKLAHILPLKAKPDIRECLHLSDEDINSFRNVIFLCSSVELAFDRLKVSFTPRSVLDQSLVLKIWDDDVRGIEICEGAGTHIGDFEGKPLNMQMPNGVEHNPFRRCFAYQALHAFIKHSSDADISHAPDVARDSDCPSFVKKRSELLEWHARFRRTRDIEVREDDEEVY